MGKLFLLLAVLSSAAMIIALRLVGTRGGNRYNIILGNYLTCVLLGLLILPDKSIFLRPDPATLICGILGGFCFVAALVLMQSSIAENGTILTSVFTKLGLLVPLAVSILFLGERPGMVQDLGILLILAAIWVIGGKKDMSRGNAPLLLLLVLLAYGCGDVMAKVFEHWGRSSQNGLYILYVFLTAGLLAVLLFRREQISTGDGFDPKAFLAGIAVGVPNFFSSTFLLYALGEIPAFIVYSVSSTGSLILVTIVGAVFFKERLSRNQILGILMILSALVMLNFQG